MEVSRKPMSEDDQKTLMSRYERSGKYSKEVLSLVQGDLEFGLTMEEVERYLKKGLDLTQMSVISSCFRSGYDQSVINVVAKEGLNGQQMSVALEFYEKGVPLDLIEKVMLEKQAPYEMRAQYQNILDSMKKVKPIESTDQEYAKKLLEQMQEVVSKINFQQSRYDALNEKLTMFESVKKDEEVRNDLLVSLAEKDQTICNQQDMIGQANANIARLRNTVEEKDDSILKLQEEIIILKNKVETVTQELEDKKRQRNKEKQTVPPDTSMKPETVRKEESPIMEQTNSKEVNEHTISYGYTIPAFCSAAFVDAKGNLVNLPVLEKENKKSNVLVPLLSKMGFLKKSRQDIMKLVSSKELTTEQLVQIRIGIEKGLKEEQLIRLVHCKAPAEKMKVFIEIAELENQLPASE